MRRALVSDAGIQLLQHGLGWLATASAWAAAAALAWLFWDPAVSSQIRKSRLRTRFRSSGNAALMPLARSWHTRPICLTARSRPATWNSSLMSSENESEDAVEQ